MLLREELALLLPARCTLVGLSLPLMPVDAPSVTALPTALCAAAAELLDGPSLTGLFTTPVGIHWLDTLAQYSVKKVSVWGSEQVEARSLSHMLPLNVPQELMMFRHDSQVFSVISTRHVKLSSSATTN